MIFDYRLWQDSPCVSEPQNSVCSARRFQHAALHASRRPAGYLLVIGGVSNQSGGVRRDLELRHAFHSKRVRESQERVRSESGGVWRDLETRHAFQWKRAQVSPERVRSGSGEVRRDLEMRYGFQGNRFPGGGPEGVRSEPGGARRDFATRYAFQWKRRPHRRARARRGAKRTWLTEGPFRFVGRCAQNRRPAKRLSVGTFGPP